MTGHNEAVDVAFEPIAAVPSVPPETASWRSAQINLLHLLLCRVWVRVPRTKMSAHPQESVAEAVRGGDS